MKYVYVLSSSVNDNYYEQFLLSVASLRLFNPDAEIVALVDTKTDKTLGGKRSAYEKYISEKKIISVPVEFSQKEASRWIKTSIHHHVSENFLFIDSDTIITESLIHDFPENIQIGAVLDNHITLDKHYLREYFTIQDKKAGFSSYTTNVRYNGGLIFCKNAPPAREFYEKWHSLFLDGRKNGCTQDMPSLNQANMEMDGIIIELGGEWNCQISHNGLPYLSKAKIIHYYATALFARNSPFIFASTRVFEKIKQTGIIPEDIQELLKVPMSAFENESRILSGKEEIDVVDSKLFSFLLRLRKKKPRLFKAFNSSLIKTLARFRRG